MGENGHFCSCKECVVRNLIFEHVSVDELADYCSSKTERTVRKGEKIVSEGDPISSFLYIKSGLLKLHRHTADPSYDQIISIAKPFDLISILSVFSDTKYNLSITAIENSVVCEFDLEKIKNLVRTNGEFALDMLARISRTTDKIIRKYNDINIKNLRGRIAYILLLFADDIYQSPIYELPISRKEIAELIGMSTENVIRILSEFRREHIIKINGKEIEIVDKDILKLICLHG
ncbi:Crp/Fnr family transcriptional regulator [Alistipes sp. ZOR0009]|uniref:Crp/Fnr family transcriptional regulator n=1 Tax=Alistipes sp. ZOR0009 TaxID=1339253 RepID=UPI0006462577|nr:Crp/Fnr family transcriptional regulator [Alistipes sp. ZOR0009]